MRRSPLLDEELKAALDAGFCVGRASENTAWCKLVDRRRNWGEADALVEFYREDAARAASA